MRLLRLVFLLGACSQNTLPPAPADGSADLTAPFADLAGVSCVTACNHCTLGGACCPGAPNSGCCNAGEWCDNGACRCGSGAGCATGQMCSGPVVSQDQCGFICCGNGVPCPR